MGRYLISTVLGGVVTLALALLMQSLIFSEAIEVAEAAPVPVIDFLMPDDTGEPLRPNIVRPSPEQPPQPPVIRPSLPIDGPVIEINLPADPFVPGPIGAGLRMPLSPTVRVLPDYPIRELERGREGFVIVGFEVNAQGRTQNHRVIASDPPQVFDNAAISSVERWRYQPQTDDDGNAITVGGQQATIQFRMNEDQ